MKSDGATCGYCGCLPTRHSKKGARFSSDSVGSTSAAGTSESASPEKWKDEDLGWFPNPKGEYTEFSNGILPKFYFPFWTTCPYKALHFQLDDHIPTKASYFISIISLGVKPPPMTVSKATSSLELRLSDCSKKVYWSVETVRALESIQISKLSPKSSCQSMLSTLLR